jgi:chloramphenicol 3-O-phosphotransferase
VIWINGAFGSGKTSVARHLAARCTGAWLLDPEQIGFMLRRLLPWTGAQDFQTLPLWREMTRQSVLAAARAGPERVAIVPMALVEPDYFDEIVGGLRREGVAVHHFSLLVSPETLRRRLRWRLERPASKRWALANGARCAILAEERFAIQIDTERRRIPEVAAEILRLLPPHVRANFA